MTELNELRIGNLISWHDGFGGVVTGLVYEVLADKVAISPAVPEGKEGGQGFMGIKGIDPIPLTPEWLERCGFKRMNAGWINDSGSLSFYDKDSETGNGVYKMEYGTRNYAAGFLYLHQLQNLCFALTGEEIEIKY